MLCSNPRQLTAHLNAPETLATFWNVDEIDLTVKQSWIDTAKHELSAELSKTVTGSKYVDKAVAQIGGSALQHRRGDGRGRSLTESGRN